MGYRQLMFIITELYVGGAERCLVNLVKGLDSSRFLASVISLAARPPAGQDQLALELEERQIPVFFLGADRNWKLPTALWKLVRILRNQRPNLVQTFLFHANVLGAIASRIAGVSPVVTNVRVADPRKSRRLERWTARRVSANCCVSQSVADHVVSAGFPPESVFIIGNSVDIDRFSPALERSSGQGARSNQAIFVGRLDPQKGVDILISVWSQLPAECASWRLKIVGHGPDHDRLQRQIAASGLADRIELLGKRSDVPELLRGSDLMILPSRWEGMSNALLEGMACGLPVLASRVEGVAEVLGESIDEQAVPAADPLALRQRLTTMMLDSKMRDRLGKWNRQRITESFSIGKMVEKYQNLYDRLLR